MLNTGFMWVICSSRSPAFFILQIITNVVYFK
nr:MAG TPA: hypothetical protein [Caudoviricetes sp.]